MKNLLIIFLFIVSISACSQKDNIKYEQALSYIEEYYSNCDKQLLEKALDILDSTSINNNQIVNTKISLYFLLKKYKEGISFMNAIPVDRFYRPYKKEMYIKSMLALNEGDPLKRHFYYEQAILSINSYLSNNPKDDQALADLFYTKLRFESRDKVLQYLDEYLKTNKNEEFLELLRQSISKDISTIDCSFFVPSDLQSED